MVEVGGATALSQSEARTIPNETMVTIHDDSKEYIVQLDVFHQLHCLVRHSLQRHSHSHCCIWKRLTVDVGHCSSCSRAILRSQKRFSLQATGERRCERDETATEATTELQRPSSTVATLRKCQASKSLFEHPTAINHVPWRYFGQRLAMV